MNKVYFDKDKNTWYVEGLEELYTFKCVHHQTNKETNLILSWSRSYPIQDGVDRVYDVEIDEVKYYFLFKPVDNINWNVTPAEPIELEKLLNEKSLFFTGEVKIVE
jgi:hypothetical protein